MYTIKMNPDKTLTKTIVTNIYQREKLVDKIQFITPTMYGDLDLGEFSVVLKYVDQSNVAHAENLIRDEEVYKENYYRYVLPVDTDLTKLAGDIEVRLSFNKIDLESKKQYTLHSAPTTITVQPLKDYYAFVPDESLEFVDQIVGALEAKMEAITQASEMYETTKADNIVLDNESNELYLTANGAQIGDKIVLNELGDASTDSSEDELTNVTL